MATTLLRTFLRSKGSSLCSKGATFTCTIYAPSKRTLTSLVRRSFLLDIATEGWICFRIYSSNTPKISQKSMFPPNPLFIKVQLNSAVSLNLRHLPSISVFVYSVGLSRLSLKMAKHSTALMWWFGPLATNSLFLSSLSSKTQCAMAC